MRKTSASRQKLNDNKIYDPIRVKKIILEKADDELKAYAQKVYLRTCINTYNLLIQENEAEYQEDVKNVRAYIIQNKKWIKWLGIKQKILAKLIVNCPCIHKVVYKLYEKNFQKRVYE